MVFGISCFYVMFWVRSGAVWLNRLCHVLYRSRIGTVWHIMFCHALTVSGVVTYGTSGVNIINTVHSCFGVQFYSSHSARYFFYMDHTAAAADW